MNQWKVLIAALALLSTSTQAKADIFAVASSDTSSDFGSGVGGGLGYNYTFTDNLALRFDLTYVRYSYQGKNFGSSAATFSRIPLFVGARGGLNLDDNLRFYLEGGLEISQDKVDAKAGYNGETFGASSGKTSMGAAFGGGLQFGFSGAAAMGLIFRNHSTGPSYFTYGLSISAGF